jgi:FK506-binding protein 1
MKMTLKVIFPFIFLYLISVTVSADNFDWIKKFSVEKVKEGDKTNFPKEQDYVTVNYRGYFPKTGQTFDSSFDRNETFTFRLGAGEVIKCWDKVVAKMSKGEYLKVICPSDFAYGAQGAGETIPANTDIAFEVELLSFSKEAAKRRWMK